MRNSADGRLALPAPGLPICELLSNRGQRPEFACCAAGILAARLAAWVCPQFFAWSEAAEALTLASLMQDLSLVFWHSVRGYPPHEVALREPDAARHHPRFSAALAEGLEAAPLMIPELVATHHERSNGAGLPAGRTQWNLSPLARLGAVITRFVELRHGPFPSHPDARAEHPEAGEATTDGVARQLLDEAERGAWDLLATRGLLRSLDALPPDRALDDAETTALPAMTAFGQRRLRLDAAHSGERHETRTPHFLQRTSRQTRIDAVGSG